MKIILLYGVGEVAKRNEALKIKKQFTPEDISQLDLKQTSVKDVEVQLASPSLFSAGPRLVVVENPPENLDLVKLNTSDNSVTLLLLAAGPKTGSLLLASAKKLSAKLLLFEGEKELSAFPFLDTLIEQKKQSFLELEKLLEEYGAMYALSMIYYLLRRNFLPQKSAFMQEKIARQKKRYDISDFIKFYSLALQTEFEIKRGNLNERLGLELLVQEIIFWEQY